MNLEWRDELETGDTQTDSRNRALIGKLNELMTRCRESRQPQEAADLMSLLMQSLQDHFAAEQAYQAQRNYLHGQEHAEQHVSLVSRLTILQEAHLDDGVSLPVVSYCLKLTYEWLTWHIIQWDKEMSVILNRRQRTRALNREALAGTASKPL